MDEFRAQAVEALVEHLHQQKRRGVRRVRLEPQAFAILRDSLARPSRAIFADPAPILREMRKPLTRPLPKADPVVEAFPIELPEGAKDVRMEYLRNMAAGCQRCPHLVRFRKQVVFGVGNLDAELMFVGEAPGADEDEQGEPFVGRAGQLLTKMIETMGVKRTDVYIGNVLKCRPDIAPGALGNRVPTSEEMATCLPYLQKQIELVGPKVLVALGATAIKGLLGEASGSIGKLRGNWLEFRGIPLMPTFHPSYLLRNQGLSEKRKVWEDLLLVMDRLAMPISDKQRGYFLSRT